jgi:acetyl-CoA C-acetyltransferase
MSNREIWIIAAARTAIGTFGGGLKDIPLADLATIAVRGALERSQVAPDQVGHLVMGNVVPTEPRDAYLSRVAAMGAGGSLRAAGHTIPAHLPSAPRARHRSASP